MGTGFLIGRLAGIASASEARWLVTGEASKSKSWVDTGCRVVVHTQLQQRDNTSFKKKPLLNPPKY